MHTNSLQAFVKAARPVTLTAALAPVLVGLALALADLRYIAAYHIATDGLRLAPALLCALFAVLMQIDANFINDYYDYKKGLDRDDRLGPPRACASGWVTPAAMRRAIIITTLLALIAGTPLIYYGGLTMIAVGAACVVFAFLYSTLFARLALGDLLVVVCFGLVPVCTTYYLQTHGTLIGAHPYSGLSWSVFYIALAQGLVTDTLLIVNNYRDRDTDRQYGRHTLATLLGTDVSEILYMMLGIIAVTLCLPLQRIHPYTAYPLALFVFTHFMAWTRMRTLKGKELNRVLAFASLNILLFALLVSIGANL